MTVSALEPVAARPQTPFQRVVSDFCESRLAVFGLVLVRGFDARVNTRLDRFTLPAAARSAIEAALS